MEALLDMHEWHDEEQLVLLSHQTLCTDRMRFFHMISDRCLHFFHICIQWADGDDDGLVPPPVVVQIGP